MNDSFSSKVASASLWSAVEKIGTYGLQFVTSMLLARLLCPEDYGVIAMLMIFIEIGRQFVECGFRNALIRKQNCNQDDFSTAFYFNIGVALVIYLVLFLIAPLVATFYNMPPMKVVLRVYGLVIIINSMTIVTSAILTQRLSFKAMAKYNILGNLISGIVGICMAYKGFGVWALVGQSILGSALLVVFLQIATKWLPSVRFSKTSMHYLWGFGSKMLATGIIGVIYSNIYSLILGKLYTPAILGNFNRGQNIAQMVPGVVGSVFMNSSLPLLSQQQDDRDRLVHVYRELSKLGSYILFPLVLLMMVLARPFVLLVLTDKWSECVIYIQIFSISMLTSAAGAINLNLLQAVGRSDLTLKAEVLKKFTGFAVVFTMLFLGPLALAIGSTIFNIFCYAINLYYAKKVVGLKYTDQLRDLYPYLLCAIAMAIAIYLISFMIQNNMIVLIMGAVVGTIIYYLLTTYILKVDYAKRFINIALKK